MPYIHGVREQLGQFARPYPYPPIRQPVPLGEFARPYPYPPIRQPVPLGGWWDDIKDTASSAWESTKDAIISSKFTEEYLNIFGATSSDSLEFAFGEVCSTDVQNLASRIHSNMFRAARQRDENKVALRTVSPSLRGKLEQALAINTQTYNNSKELLDRLQFIMMEGYKLGITSCERYFGTPTTNRGVSGFSGLGNPAAAVGGFLLRYGTKLIVAGAVVAGLIWVATKQDEDLTTAKAMSDAVTNASQTTKLICERNPSSVECREARQHELNLAKQSNEAFRDYANRKADEEDSGVTGTIQTVAIAGVVGVLGFMAIKAFTK